MAGFAARDVTPMVGVPLGGYGGRERRAAAADLWRPHPHARFFVPSTGTLDPIRAKAMVLELDEHRLLFLSLDVVGVTARFRQAIVSGVMSLGFHPDHMFVSATHTHSGPGTLSRDLIWQLLAMDVFRRSVYDRFLAGVVDTVREAVANAQPVDLRATSFAAVGLQRNRRHDQGFYDPTANLLLAKSVRTGRWTGVMANLAIHGTALQSDNLKFSADVPGGIERSLEARLGATALFVNGAVADVSPTRTGPAGISLIGDQFAEQAMAAVNSARPVGGEWAVHTRVITLAKPTANLRHCDAIQRFKRDIPLSWLLPRQVRISVVQLGDMMWLTWPGEPTTSLGFALKGVATDAGMTQPCVMGLTDGYGGYFVTPAEYRAGGYEACKSLYGPDAGVQVVDEFRSLLGRR